MAPISLLWTGLRRNLARSRFSRYVRNVERKELHKKRLEARWQSRRRLLLSVAEALAANPESFSIVARNLDAFSTNESPVIRQVGKRWRRILGNRSPREVAALLKSNFDNGAATSRRSELLDLIASAHPFAGVVPEERYRQILREEFSFR